MEAGDQLQDGAITVAIHATFLVKPASPSPQPFLLLSPCDMVWRDYTYNRRLLFYHRPSKTSRGANGSSEDDDDDALLDDYPLFLSTLRDSLSRVLAFFYPFAGRFVKESPDEGFTVACNDEGAELVEASIHGISFAELQKCNFDMKPYYVHLTRWANYSRPLHEGSAPLLSIQVTRFSCGSIVMGIAHSHALADGVSLWHFMNSWAELARGKALSLYPSHDRTPLILKNPSLKGALIQGFEDINHFKECEKVEIIKQRVFSFSKDMVSKLKKKTKDKFGTYEVLCAHIWKKVSKARAHASDTTVLGFGNAVNMRNRMDPPLPSGYFGNALLWGIATTTMGELQREDLTITAARIRTAVGTCSNARMQQMLSFVQLYGRVPFWRKLCVNAVRMRVSSSPKFPVMSTDFGWGRPLVVRSAVVEDCGKLVFYPGSDGIGSADVCLAFPNHMMDNLEGDTSFLLELL